MWGGRKCSCPTCLDSGKAAKTKVRTANTKTKKTKVQAANTKMPMKAFPIWRAVMRSRLRRLEILRARKRDERADKRRRAQEAWRAIAEEE